MSETIGLSKEVLEFAQDMQKKLNENSHKGGWGNCLFIYLLNRLEEEVAELRDAMVSNQKREVVIAECADVANFAMMITDRARTDW